MIELDQLEFRYPDDGFRLRIDRLAIGAGQRIAFVGASGTGKTTLLHLMAGIRVPFRGRVTTNDVDLGSLDDAGRRAFRIRNVGLVFQEFELVEYLTVLDNILLPYRIDPSMSLTAPVRQSARALACELGIGDKLDRHPDHLSQGERQRVAVCRALLPAPAVLLADEPTGNLDPANKERVLELLLDQTGRRGTTLVVVTHDHDILPRFERTVDFADFHEPGAPDR